MRGLHEAVMMRLRAFLRQFRTEEYILTTERNRRRAAIYKALRDSGTGRVETSAPKRSSDTRPPTEPAPEPSFPGPDRRSP